MKRFFKTTEKEQRSLIENRRGDMEEKRFPGGGGPVMLFFTEENQVDYAALKELVEWYIVYG